MMEYYWVELLLAAGLVVYLMYERTTKKKGE